MKIAVFAKPNARHEKVELLPSGEYRVSVNAPPQEGKANEAIIRVLAQHFGVPKSAVEIVAGHKGKKKWVEISE